MVCACWFIVCVTVCSASMCVYCVCVQPNHNVTEAKELRLLCAEDEQSRTCWVTGIRLVKVSYNTTTHTPV